MKTRTAQTEIPAFWILWTYVAEYQTNGLTWEVA